MIAQKASPNRHLKVDMDTGKVVFDFVNAYNLEEEETLFVSAAFVFDRATVETSLQTDCESVEANK